MSHLGGLSSLPRWQQPTQDRNTPPNRGLSPEESAHGFQWGKDPIPPRRVYDDHDRPSARATWKPDRAAQRAFRDQRVGSGQWGGRLMSMYTAAAIATWSTTRCSSRPTLPRSTPGSPAASSGMASFPAIRLSPPARSFKRGPWRRERGPVLRIYGVRSDRRGGPKIDLFLPEDDDRLYVHGRIVNSDPAPKLAYWWTNVAAPMVKGRCGCA